jgi:hypothetical protein
MRCDSAGKSAAWEFKRKAKILGHLENVEKHLTGLSQATIGVRQPAILSIDEIRCLIGCVGELNAAVKDLTETIEINDE